MLRIVFLLVVPAFPWIASRLVSAPGILREQPLEAATHPPDFVHERNLIDFRALGSREEVECHWGAFRLERAAFSSDGVLLRPQLSAAGAAVLETPPLVQSAFRECLVSWNVDAPVGTGFVVELRTRPLTFVVGRRVEPVADFSPWLCIGEWGVVAPEARVTEWTGGHVDVDFLRSEAPQHELQVRIRCFASASDPEVCLRVERIAVCTSDVRGLARPGCRTPGPDGILAEADWRRRLPVPARSQKVEDPSIASRICSPTALAMVLAYHGVDRPTREVAERAFDSEHDLYGNWPRNVQAAFSFGVPGYLDRFTHWSDVEQKIAQGLPLILSVRAKKGELAGAPYAETSGHLIVLVGFDARDGCLVHDPAASDAAGVFRTYTRADLEKVWMGRGGVAYVLLSPRR